MEAIPIEVIDMADDFFSHLDEQGKEDVLSTYYNEQPNILKVYEGWLKAIVYKGTVEKSENLFFVIYRSYQYYGIKLPIIEDKQFFEAFDNFRTYNHHPNGQPLTNLQSMKRLKKQLNQDYLMDYVMLKIFGSPENPSKDININDVGIMVLLIVLLLNTLNNEMKKHVVDEIL